MMLLKCCTQYVSKFGKLSCGHRTGKRLFSFRLQSRAMLKNVQITVHLCSFHMLAKLCSKSFQVYFSSIRTKNFPMYKLSCEEAQEPEIKWLTFVGSWRKQGNSRKKSVSLITLQPFTMWITTNCGKFLKRWEYQTTLPAS